MGLTILHTADWHLGSPFASFPEEQRAFLRQQQRRIPMLAADLCREHRCDLVLLAGDIWDSPTSRDCLPELKQALARCRVPVVIAPGNHDYCCPGSPWLEEVWPENVHIFTGGTRTLVIPELDCRIYGAGYRSMDCPGLLDSFRAQGSEKWCIGVFHGDPLFPNSPCCPITRSQVRESGLDYLALGHIHKGGSFRAGSTLCAWPGCPMGRGWDETGEKEFLIVHLDEAAGVQLTGVSSGLPCFRELRCDVGELEAQLPPVESQDFYRVTLTGAAGVQIPDFPHLPHLEFIDQTEEPMDLWSDVGQDSLRGEFFRTLRDTDADEEILRLAAEISHRLLDGREVLLP